LEKLMRWIYASFLALALVALQACSPPSGPVSTPTTPAASPSWTPLAYEDCGWQWAEQSLAELTDTFQQALAGANLFFDPEKTRAYAFGENCLDKRGNVQYFASMETDFIVATTPADVTDQAALGNYAGQVLRLILSDFTPGTVPGPQPGNVEFVFVGPGLEIRRRVSLVDAQKALRSALEGAELYRALFP
jgi:hypothetical protein